MFIHEHVHVSDEIGEIYCSAVVCTLYTQHSTAQYDQYMYTVQLYRDYSQYTVYHVSCTAVR